MAWLSLVVAGLLEVAWAVGLKHSDGFSKPGPTAFTLVAMLGSFALLAHALRTIPLGTGYAVWTGIGAVGTAVYGVAVLGEPATAGRLACFVLIVAGILGLKLLAPAPAPVTTTFFAAPPAFSAYADGAPWGPGTDVVGGRVALPEDEARHAARVLRLRTGDEVVVVDGAGGWHDVRLDRVERDVVEGEVRATRWDVNEPAAPLVLALPPLKSPDRFEFAVEKAVELGVTDLVVLQTERTQGRPPKPARLQNVLVAALKQALRSRLVRTSTADLERALAAHPPLPQGLGFVMLHEGAEATRPLPDVLDGLRAPMVLVGPEGGFAPAEVAAAGAAGVPLATLGARRLRAETAAVAACAAILVHRLRHA